MIAFQVTVPSSNLLRDKSERIFYHLPDGQMVVMDSTVNILNENALPPNCRAFAQDFQSTGDSHSSDFVSYSSVQGWRKKNAICSASTDSRFIMTEWYETTDHFEELVGKPFTANEHGNASMMAMIAHDAMLEMPSFSLSDGFEFVSFEKDVDEQTWLTLCGTFHVYDVETNQHVLLPHGTQYNPSEESHIKSMYPEGLQYPFHDSIIDTHMASTRAIGYQWFEKEVHKPGLIRPEPESVLLPRGKTFVVLNWALRTRFKDIPEAVDFVLSNCEQDDSKTAMNIPGIKGPLGMAIVRT